MTRQQRALSRFVRFTSAERCWIWTGAQWRGYGLFKVDGKNHKAHRWYYELVRGPLKRDTVLDHLCRNTLCVNPCHLEPVTQRENVLRGKGWPAMLSKLTRCKRGHLFTPENTITRKDGHGRRECRTCHNSWSRAKRRHLIEQGIVDPKTL